MSFLSQGQKRCGGIYMLVNSLLGAVAALSLSCGSSTYNTSLTYFPTNATEHTEFTLQVVADGQVGKSYYGSGTKQVFVEVFHNGALYFESKKYTVEGEKLEWEVNWDEFSSPSIRFFEEGSTNKTIKTISLTISPKAH